ncbi:TOBE domain-containing protein [Sphingomonas azotifigens]|uniref:TOBE domain-containing protein n=1 Tax=Sphingomonas azotifigens TaxID=330920 RepID=UPI0009FBD855|nr:TOBE domain-containing protein [Sphingomonas azotifigens]
MLKTSARNMLPTVVTSIAHGGVNAEVGLLLGEQTVLDAIITNRSVERLGLKPGGKVRALIKSSSVILAESTPGLLLSARNQLGGTVTEVREGPVSAEVLVDIGGGTTIVAVVTTHSAADLGIAPGKPIVCCVKASSIILAVEG